MPVAAAVLMSTLLLGATEVSTVQAPDSPVRLDHATILTATDAPPVLLYAATNVTGDQLDEFTVRVFSRRGRSLRRGGHSTRMARSTRR